MSLALSLDGSVAPRTTEHYGYPLPPNDRFEVERARYGQYKLPHPITGEAGRFSRVSTIAHVLDDTYNLDKWQKRNVVGGLLKSPAGDGESYTPELAVAALKIITNPGPNAKRDLDEVVDRAEIASNAGVAAEFGTAVHEWCESLDRGECTLGQVPELFREHCRQYLVRLAVHGIFAVPMYCERIVFCTRNGIDMVGTLDRIYQLADGTFVLGDLKTSKTLEWNWLGFAIQLAAYRDATHMLSIDGTRWEPMPILRDDFAVLSHIPSDNAENTGVVTFDLAFGRLGLDVATKVRVLRKAAKKSVPYLHALPTPTAAQAAWHNARVALLCSRTVDDVSAVWASYREVWDDTLTAIGNHVVSLNATPRESDRVR